MAIDKKAMVEALKQRTKESITRQTGGFVSIFKDDVEAEFWKVKEGDHTIDIIPYTVGSNDPKYEEGEYGYVLRLQVHKKVGPAEGDYICLAENYKKPCPICEHRRQLVKEGADDDEIKALKPKSRCVYNIVCYDSDKEEDKGVQIWEFSDWYSERYFKKLAKPKRRRGQAVSKDPIYFASPFSDGKSIEFTREGTGAENTSFFGHAFVDRDYDIPDEILESAYCLDELIEIPSYDELYEVFWGGSKEGDDAADDKEQSSRRSSRSRGRREPVQEDDAGSQDGDDVCPGGGTFGIDIDTLEYCEDCDSWNDCAREKARLLSDKLKKDDPPFESDEKNEPEPEPEKEKAKPKPKEEKKKEKTTTRRRRRRS